MINIEKGLNYRCLTISGQETGAAKLLLEMLRENEVEGMPDLKINCQNGDISLSYDIVMLNSYSEYCIDKKISAEDIKELIDGAAHQSDILESYLCEAEGLLLDPKYIYVNDNGTLKYCYDPFRQIDVKRQLDVLSRFLLIKADDNNPDSIRAALEVYKAVSEDNFNFSYISEKIAALLKSKSDIEINPNETFISEEKTVFNDLDDEKRVDDFSDSIREEEFIRAAEEPASNISSIWIDDLETELEKEEIDHSIFGKHKKKKIKSHKQKENVIEDNQFEESFFRGESDSGAVNNCFYETKRYALVPERGGSRIDIKEYPFLIGKLKYAVDACIEDCGISRFHARFDQTRGKVYISDLNSLNGTFLNDVRLKGNEQKEVKNNDRITVGRIGYRLMEI